MESLTRKILVVDDEPAHLLISMRALRKFGSTFTGLGASGFEEAEKILARKERIALFVIDLNLGDFSGAEIIKLIRAHPIYAETPAIMISTSKLEEDQRRSYAAGANVFLPKNSDPGIYQNELVSAISKLLGPR